MQISVPLVALQKHCHPDTHVRNLGQQQQQHAAFS